MNKKTGTLGGEDLIWVREEASKMIADQPIAVKCVYMNKDKLVIEMFYLELTEFDDYAPNGQPQGNDVLVIVRTVNDLLISFVPYVKARVAHKRAESRDLRKMARIRLNDWDGHYLNQ